MSMASSCLPQLLSPFADNAIKHFKRKKDELEAHQTKAALITLRKSFIENQKRHNYNNEYERLIGILTNKSITHSANTQIQHNLNHVLRI